MLVDVDRIIASHADLNHEGMGRRGLGHITRSGVLTLCAAWELYLEEVLVESVRVLIARADTPDQLPKSVQKALAKVVRSSKHELKPLELAGQGWESVYDHYAADSANKLNSPKGTVVDPMFEQLVGCGELSSSWSVGVDEINKFVSTRGDIAHRGRDAGYVKIDDLIAYRSLVVRTVVDTDNALADFIQGNSNGYSPWRRRNS